MRRWSKETYIAILAACGIVFGLAARFLALNPTWERASLLAVLILCGAPLLWDLARKAWAREFGSDLLAGLSIATSLVLGEYLAGSIVVLMLSGGAALESYAARRASGVLAALAKRVPRTAHVLRQLHIADIDLDEIKIGDSLIVLPHEICPVDGIVTEGRSDMNEAYLTGEPFEISKVPGSTVLSGAVNGEAALTVTVASRPVDSRYAKIMRVMREAEERRPPFRRIADRLGSWYTVLAVAVAVVGWVAGGTPSRFLAVLVIATPCPLLLAIPVAIVGSISMAASRAIIIKDPGVLERIASCRTAIFDKTGTLTYGKPLLTDISVGPGIAENQALRMAASLEQYSKHPLARSVVEAAVRRDLDLGQVSEISERPGCGLQGRVDGSLVEITGSKQFFARFAGAQITRLENSSGMECFLLLNGTYAATFEFHDTPREEGAPFIAHLGPRHGIEKVMLLSGDRQSEVQYLAQRVGITEVFFGKSPEEKLAIVRTEVEKAPVLFLGDGINDAPAMQAATVGIAFGQNSDITAEAADAVIMDASLSKVDELIHIGRRMRRIVLQSAVGGMALSTAGMVLGATGHLSPVAGAIAQEVIDVAAVLNALRAAFPGGALRDFEAPVI